MKRGETTRGEPLNGAAVKVTPYYFLIGLSSVDADMQRNIGLLKERSWLDIPIVYGDGKRAILAVEKAPLAEQALAALTSSQPSVAAVAPPTFVPSATTKAPPSQLTASAEHRVALVIGNSQYRSVAFLSNPRRDAKAVADALRQADFQMVDLKMDLDREGMVKALRAFRDQADKADWALIYFAGHGIEINRVNYLIPTDAKLRDDRDVQAEAVSYEELLNTIGRAKALRLVILDACRVNPFKERMNRTMASRGTDRGLAPPPESPPGTLIAYSAKDGEVAEDGDDGANSPFAQAFVSELKVPGREVRRLFDYVRDDVLEATHNRQQPFTYGSLPGRRDFYFVAKRDPPSQPPPQTAAAQPDESRSNLRTIGKWFGLGGSEPAVPLPQQAN
jgi:Caspase domain